MPDVKISVPSLYVAGLSPVKVGSNVALYARKANGDLEATPAMTFVNDGPGIAFRYEFLSSGSSFLDGGNGRILAVS